MNRGSIGKSSMWKFLITGFNEAPIHESGKCHSVIRFDPMYP